MLLVGVVSIVLAATGTFERLLSLAILLVLLTDGFMVLVLFRLRAAAGGGAVPGALLPAAAAPSSWACTRCCSWWPRALSRSWPWWRWACWRWPTRPPGSRGNESFLTTR